MVALLMIVAVATVLISPDPTDDVPGILHQHLKVQKMAVIVHLPVNIAAHLAAGIVFGPGRISGFSCADLAALTCVRLC